MKNKKKKIIIISIILLLIIPLSVAAKYIYNSLYEHYLTTKGFYFYSDFLDISTKEYKLDNWSGSENYNISFNLYNYQNDLKYTSSNIEYNISYECSSNVSCSTDLYNNQGVLSGEGKNYSRVNLVIEPTEPLHAGDEVSVLVKASTNNIFRKELKAKYIITVNDIDYNIVDNAKSMYAILNIVNSSDKEKSVTLNFDNSIVNIDTSNKLVVNGTSYNRDEYLKSVTIKLSPLSDNSIYFYKKNVDNDYSYPGNNNESIISISY